jgi:hypothetical protein
MNTLASDQNNDPFLTYEVSDEALEGAANTERGKENAFTQWICTAVYFCPGA